MGPRTQLVRNMEDQGRVSKTCFEAYSRTVEEVQLSMSALDGTCTANLGLHDILGGLFH